MSISAEMFTAMPLRAVGMGFCVGESVGYFRSFNINTWRLMDGCYTVGFVYCLAHVVVTVVETLDGWAVLRATCFQILCSMIMPTIVVYHACRLTWNVLSWIDDNMHINIRLRECVVTIGGLVLTYLLIEPMDQLGNTILDTIGLTA